MASPTPKGAGRTSPSLQDDALDMPSLRAAFHQEARISGMRWCVENFVREAAELAEQFIATELERDVRAVYATMAGCRRTQQRVRPG